jgi:hypothetical protein
MRASLETPRKVAVDTVKDRVTWAAGSPSKVTPMIAVRIIIWRRAS